MNNTKDEQPAAGWLAELIDRLNDISVSQIPHANFEVVDALDKITDELRKRLGAAAAESAKASDGEKTAFALRRASRSMTGLTED